MTNYRPDGWPSVIPRLATEDPEALVTFIQQVFNAQGEYQTNRPTELWIDQSLIMVGNILEREASQSFLYVYVADTVEVYNRAIQAGAISIEAPALMPYGDRRAMFADVWGNHWQVATHIGFKAT